MHERLKAKEGIVDFLFYLFLVFVGWVLGVLTIAICQEANCDRPMVVEYRATGLCRVCGHRLFPSGQCPAGCGYQANDVEPSKGWPRGKDYGSGIEIKTMGADADRVVYRTVDARGGQINNE